MTRDAEAMVACRCGGKPERRNLFGVGPDKASYRCDAVLCAASTPWMESPSLAADIWNAMHTRTPAAAAMPAVTEEMVNAGYDAYATAAERAHAEDGSWFGPNGVLAAIYRAMRSAEPVAAAMPEGYVMVPREPTPKMLVAGTLVDEAPYDPGGVYRAMIAAALSATPAAAAAPPRCMACENGWPVVPFPSTWPVHEVPEGQHLIPCAYGDAPAAAAVEGDPDAELKAASNTCRALSYCGEGIDTVLLNASITLDNIIVERALRRPAPPADMENGHDRAR